MAHPDVVPQHLQILPRASSVTPSTTVATESGIVWDNFDEILNPSYLPHQVKRAARGPRGSNSKQHPEPKNALPYETRDIYQQGYTSFATSSS